MDDTDFKPQPIELLRARYKKALEVSYNATKIAADKVPDRPGMHRENIFDFENGIRLIISRDVLGHIEGIHVSGSFAPSIYKGKVMIEPLLKAMTDCYYELSGEPKDELHFVAFSQQGIPHWIIKRAIIN